MASWKPFSKTDSKDESAVASDKEKSASRIQTASAEEPANKRLMSFFKSDDDNQLRADPFLQALESDQVIARDLNNSDKPASNKKPVAEKQLADTSPVKPESKKEIQVTSLTTDSKKQNKSKPNSAFADGFDEELNRLRKEYDVQNQEAQVARTETSREDRQIDKDLLDSLFEDRETVSTDTKEKQQTQISKRQPSSRATSNSFDLDGFNLDRVDADLVQQLDKRHSPFEEVESNWSAPNDPSGRDSKQTASTQTQESNWLSGTPDSHSGFEPALGRDNFNRPSNRQRSTDNNRSMIKESDEVPSRFSERRGTTLPYYNSDNINQSRTQHETPSLFARPVAPMPPTELEQRQQVEFNGSPSNVQPAAASGHQRPVSNALASVSANQSISVPEETVPGLFTGSSSQNLASNSGEQTASLFDQLNTAPKYEMTSEQPPALIPPIFGSPETVGSNSSTTKKAEANNFVYTDSIPNKNDASTVEMTPTEKTESPEPATSNLWDTPRIIYMLGIAFGFVFMLNLLRRGGRVPKRRSLLKQRR